jgi:Bacterial protein of unknown function (DUF922)
MKIFLILFSFVATQYVSAQKVIIAGNEGNRLLVWSDFTGKPTDSNFGAMTFWNIKYKIANVVPNGENMTVNGFEVTLELDAQKSWVKADKKSESLLKHEQGHFDLGLMCMKEILAKQKAATYTKKNFNESIKNIFLDTNKKYHEMGIKYDEETDHGRVAVAQAEWDKYFRESLNDKK